MNPLSSEIFNKTLATLVLYNTSLENSITFQSLSKALEKGQVKMNILVYDNSAIAQPPASFPGWNIHLVHNAANPGVSKAYNAGFDLAKQLKMDWLLLLDQDTEYPPSAIESYANAIQQNPKQEIFVPELWDNSGLVSPFQFRFGGGKRINIKPGIHAMQNLFFHNCGMLVSMNYFNRAGGYDERFPLDFSDLSFVKRLQKIASTFMLTPVSAKHALAATSKTTTRERAKRFTLYVKACRTFKNEYSQNDIFISLRLFLRSIKLCWIHKSFRFIGIYLNL